MAGERVPRFELHILPLMRLLDRDHMLPFGLDLWNYDAVKTSADDIIQFLRNGPMPPASHGGPWPPEWIDLFVRWKDTGFQRLQLATAAPGGLTASRSGTLVSLVARGRVPGPGFGVWLTLDRVEADRRDYTLVQEPPLEPAAGPDRPFTARERFETAADPITVTVTDATGTHDVPLAQSLFVHLLGPFARVKQELDAMGLAVAGDDPDTATLQVGDETLTVTSNQMFTEVTGSPAALAQLAARIGPRVRR